MTESRAHAAEQSSSTSDLGALSRLTVDLGAIRANYQRLSTSLGEVQAGAVVKANAYGLGVDRVAPMLWDAGCRFFFTATLPEAVQVRALLPEADVSVLNGLVPGFEPLFAEHRIFPALGSLEQVEHWRAHGERLNRALPALLHVDTGMSRTGLDAAEWRAVLDTPAVLDGVEWRYLMSHLSCSDDPAHPENARQLEAFQAIRSACPRPMRFSLANSAACLFDTGYHFDLARPGIGLYGGNPRADRPNPHTCPIRLEGRVLQTRTIAPGTPVSYGATWRAKRETTVATIGAGYADGYLRSLSDRGHVAFGKRVCPVIGRVTMDTIMVDVTDLPHEDRRAGTFAELLGPTLTPDDMAAAAGTISYELLTSLGARYARHYIDTGSPAA
jgi:alanine racemase